MVSSQGIDIVPLQQKVEAEFVIGSRSIVGIAWFRSRHGYQRRMGSLNAWSLRLNPDQEIQRQMIELEAADNALPRLPKRFFEPEAFSNPHYLRFAIRGGLTAGLCYVTCTLHLGVPVSWAVH